MKKVLFILFCVFISIQVCEAECNYTERKNLNVLASHVEYNYSYDENSKQFAVILSNVPDKLYVTIGESNYFSQDNVVEVFGFNYGDKVKVNINSSTQAECVYELLRVINITLPYLNPYFGSNECSGHENLEVCNSKFLDYQISKKTFDKLIKEDFQSSISENPKEHENPVSVTENTTFFEKIWEYVKVFSIPVALVVVTSLITIFICGIIYRKIKYGL